MSRVHFDDRIKGKSGVEGWYEFTTTEGRGTILHVHFLGTDHKDDWKRNLMCWPKQIDVFPHSMFIPAENFAVHAGAYEYAVRAWGLLVPVIRSRNVAEIHVSGHSMGAMIAQVFLLFLATKGSPTPFIKGFFYGYVKALNDYAADYLEQVAHMHWYSRGWDLLRFLFPWFSLPVTGDKYRAKSMYPFPQALYWDHQPPSYHKMGMPK